MSLEDVGKLTLSLLINAALLLALFQLAAVTPLNAREAWRKVPGAISGAIAGAVAILLMMVSTTQLAYYLSIGDMQATALVRNESTLLDALLGAEAATRLMRYTLRFDYDQAGEVLQAARAAE